MLCEESLNPKDIYIKICNQVFVPTTPTPAPQFHKLQPKAEHAWTGSKLGIVTEYFLRG